MNRTVHKISFLWLLIAVRISLVWKPLNLSVFYENKWSIVEIMTFEMTDHLMSKVFFFLSIYISLCIYVAHLYENDFDIVWYSPTSTFYYNNLISWLGSYFLIQSTAVVEPLRKWRVLVHLHSNKCSMHLLAAAYAPTTLSLGDGKLISGKMLITGCDVGKRRLLEYR